MAFQAKSSIELQAKEHPLVTIDRFNSVEDFVLHLIHQRAYEEIVPSAGERAVLDLGCNNGYGTDLLASVARSVVGVDVSETALIDARRRFPSLDFQLVDGVSLPFEADRFDIITSFQVIEHVMDVPMYLAEIARVLKPGGMAIFTTPNASIRLDAGMIPWNRFHVREYRGEQLQVELEKAFAIVKIKGLFATHEAYQVEYNRCQRALESARQSGNSGQARNFNRSLKGLAKQYLPAGALASLRQIKSKVRNVVGGDKQGSDYSDRFKTSDFFYQEHDIDRALDLMAVCRKS